MAVAGANAAYLQSPVETEGQDLTTVARFTVGRGERKGFALTWAPSHEAPPHRVDVRAAVEQTDRWWRDWVAGGDHDYARLRDLVVRSLITLKALIYGPTGGMVAAPTTSLPECLGGVRNFDYRYCWVRDATFTLYAMLGSGYRDEARRWRDWLLRAIAGDPARMPVVYRVDGERLLSETPLSRLPGYRGSRPVRVGNAAFRQLQLDVFGEVVDSMCLTRRAGVAAGTQHAWDLQRSLLDHLESTWYEPDEGIWEMRGGRQHFTHSKVMAWVAFDRAARAVEEWGVDGPHDRWCARRDEIRDEICDKAWDDERSTFTLFYGSRELDASLLRIPLVGFLPANDDRVRGTVDAIVGELSSDGFLRRYSEGAEVDGLPGRESAFLPCMFWLVDYYALLGRFDEAQAVFDRAASAANDVGLLSEEYDPAGGELLGNFPQALTHVALVNSALNLTRAGEGPAHHRSQR